ncbi:MAG TPA: DUF4112 domain-containing protein [Gemmatimonadales bacterium]|nr:DUF4112 domain-containing protein [Gemmatimonadales bacterium]
MNPGAGSLERYRRLATALDARFRIPGLGIRIGYDAILGLVPGAGDIITGILASYGLLAGYRLGAPASVLIRMLGNIALDILIGVIPVLGDFFDIGWKANLRNLALLDRWEADPRHVERRSAALLGGIVLTTLLLFAVIVYAIVRVLAFVFRA